MKIGDILQYKDFLTQINFSQEDQVFHGILLNLEKGDTVSFHGETLDLFLSDFHEAVDQYIEIKEENKGVLITDSDDSVQ